MELWDLYNSDRTKSGKTVKRGEPIPDGYYHLVVHIVIFNSNGEMLIQQRQPFKDGWANMWDITVGGSSVAGDTSRTAAHRELLEEVGIDISFDDAIPAFSVRYPLGFDDFYVFTKDVDIDNLKLQCEEVQRVVWADKEKILSLIDAGEFIPYHKGFIEMLFFAKDNTGVHTWEEGE